MRDIHVYEGGREKKFPHLFHLLLTVFSCGLWLPVWVCLWLLNLMMGR